MLNIEYELRKLPIPDANLKRELISLSYTTSNAASFDAISPLRAQFRTAFACVGARSRRGRMEGTLYVWRDSIYYDKVGRSVDSDAIAFLDRLPG